MESDGAGEIVFGHRGLMQDSVQLQGQQKKRQQMVLDGCGGEAREESRNGYGENGGAAARAAAGERPLIVLTISRKEQRIRRERERRRDKAGALGTGEESDTESESGEDLNGGAAACAAARIEKIDAELWGMQNGMADLMVERRGLVRMMQDSVNEAAALERQEVAGREKADGDGESDAEMIIVENLKEGVNEEQLRDTFGQIGVVTHVEQQYSTAVVAFETAEMAQEAQQSFDGVELCGRKMSVSMVWWSVDGHQEGDGSDSDLGGEEV